MPDFGFSRDEEMFRAEVREFAERVLSPMRRSWDHDRQYPLEQMQRLLESGLPGRAREIGPTNVLRGIFAEEIARADFNCVYPLLPLWAGPGGSMEGMGLPAPLAEQVSRGERLQALAITEAQTGSDAGHAGTTAVRDGDDWVLNGEKNSVSTLNADYFVVFARTGTVEEGAKGVSGFLVTRDSPGVSISEPFADMGNRATPRGVLTLTNVRVPASNQLSGVGMKASGFEHIGRILDTNRAIIGLICLGAAAASVEETVAYAKERVLFGRPISMNQGVAFPLVEASTLMEAARLLCYKALWMADQGLRHTTEGAMIKWWVPRLAGDVIRECIVLRGHMGYTEELPLEQRLRDVLGWEIGDGTPQICKLVVARALFGREAAPL
ncbi:MAG: acyl-CoA dehydrogenase family protein [Thermoflexaceae bacterium]|nr:acyl-CoA dehydrogenase family protein [Thermoflexaceae bacterium]